MKKILFVLMFSLCLESTYSIAQNLNWANTAGSTAGDMGFAIAVDTSGNVYSTGYFTGTVDFDSNSGIVNLTSVGSADVFVTKTDALGNLVWAKSIGGVSSDEGHGIVVDNLGNVYITGSFNGTVDFDPNAGIANISVVGPTNDIFILKLSQLGNYVWAKNFGSTGSDVGSGLAIDASNNIYITGYYNGTVDFDPNAGIQNLTSSNGRDIFVCKLDENANYLWAKSMGGSGGDEGLSIAVDILGNVFTTGYFSNTGDFDPGLNVFNLTASGTGIIFISKLDVNGNFVWAKSIGNADVCHATSIAVDVMGSSYITGFFQGTTDFDPNAGVTNLIASNKDIFIVKFDTIGDLLWAKNIGSNGSDYGYSITVDAASNVYTTGVFEGTTDFDPNAGVANLTVQFIRDMFVCKLDGLGNYVWAKNITGAAGLSEGYGITIDNADNIYTTGYFYGTVDFDFSSGVDNHTSAGIQDYFIMKTNQLLTQVRDISEESHLIIYPNPSNGTFYIKNIVGYDLRKSAVTLTDLKGNEILTYDITLNEKNNYVLNLVNLAKGIYLIKISSENGIVRSKIVLN